MVSLRQVVRTDLDRQLQIQSPNHRHRNLKAIEERVQMCVSLCFVTEGYLYKFKRNKELSCVYLETLVNGLFVRDLKSHQFNSIPPTSQPSSTFQHVQLKPQNHGLSWPNHALGKLKVPRGWAYFPRLNIWQRASSSSTISTVRFQQHAPSSNIWLWPWFWPWHLCVCVCSLIICLCIYIYIYIERER